MTSSIDPRAAQPFMVREGRETAAFCRGFSRGIANAIEISEQVDDCHPYEYDSGSTEEGYRQAKRHIIEKLQTELSKQPAPSRPQRSYEDTELRTKLTILVESLSAYSSEADCEQILPANMQSLAKVAREALAELTQPQGEGR